MPPYDTRQSQRKCIRFTEELERQREKQASKDGPQPWILQKLAVIIVVCLVGYTVYVYVVRFCIPMIRREAESMGGRAMGTGFLVVFSIFFLMFCWAYLKVVLTPPGYARDYVARTPPPIAQPQPAYQPWSSEDSVAGTPYAPTSRSNSRSQPSLDITSSHTPHSRSPSHSRRNAHEASMGMSQVRPSERLGAEERGLLDVVPAVLSSRAALNANSEAHHPRAAHMAQNASVSNSGLPPPLYSRQPPTHPALSPEYRYCSRDGFVKPMRAHHCRACGTCILKYDHHCPWIGQCVGAYNHKFFVNFLLWSSTFTIFVFTSLVARNIQATTSNSIHASIDPQHIVIIALSGIFTIFTLTLFVSHVQLILINASTVEHLGMQRMHDRERGVLSQMTTCPCSTRPHHPPEAYGLPDNGGCSPFKFVTFRQRILKQWDAEWGRIGKEGNLWWLGSKRANWESTMGTGKLGWILPVGRSVGDGLTYPTNPRFDRDGRWRRRVEWPEGLR